MYDILIRNATILDGTGKPGYQTDVGVKDGRVVFIGKAVVEGEQEIDGTGLCLAPGFIDPHTHSDMTLVMDPHAESKIRQGVTTEVIGNCGSSPAPLLGAAWEEAKSDYEIYKVEISWQDMAGYIQRLNTSGVAVNVVPLVGHNTVRGSVLGYDDVQPTREQQAEMERLVEEAMQQGARGISTGLYYPPGLYAGTSEVVGLARAAAKHGGIYASHIRSESDALFPSIDEAIEIGRQAGARVQISHLKLEGYHNFEGADRLLETIERANHDGIPVGTDQYPYTASSTWLAAMLPNWAQAGGGKAVAKRLRDPQIRAQLRQDREEHRVDWENRGGINTWDQVLVSEASKRPEFVGKNLAEAASEQGKDPLDALFDLIADCDGSVGGVFFDQLEDNVRMLMQYDRLVTGSDGVAMSSDGILGESVPHPRSYGTFPRVLGRYVREYRVLKLEEAVRKMTSLTAEYFGLQDRGVVREGAWADLVLFDPNTVIDQATYTQPHQYPGGIPYVIVNGTAVIHNGRHTGALPGKVL
jgi:N-acyl-D-amino-acid deacylase